MSEHFVKNSIKYRIDHRARVAEPRNEVEHSMVNLLFAFGTDGRQEVEDEEGGPEDDEGEEDDSEHLGGLLLKADDAAVAGRVARHDGRVAAVMCAHTRGTASNAGSRPVPEENPSVRVCQLAGGQLLPGHPERGGATQDGRLGTQHHGAYSAVTRGEAASAWSARCRLPRHYCPTALTGE